MQKPFTPIVTEAPETDPPLDDSPIATHSQELPVAVADHLFNAVEILSAGHDLQNGKSALYWHLYAVACRHMMED